MQVFYARDNKTKGRLKVVLEGKRKIVGVDGVTDEEDYRAIRKCIHSGRTYPYLSFKRVTNLFTYELITMRPSLLMHLKIVIYC